MEDPRTGQSPVVESPSKPVTDDGAQGAMTFAKTTAEADAAAKAAAQRAQDADNAKAEAERERQAKLDAERERQAKLDAEREAETMAKADDAKRQVAIDAAAAASQPAPAAGPAAPAAAPPGLLPLMTPVQPEPPFPGSLSQAEIFQAVIRGEHELVTAVGAFVDGVRGAKVLNHAGDTAALALKAAAHRLKHMLVALMPPPPPVPAPPKPREEPLNG
jgi:hypothetical protein